MLQRIEFRDKGTGFAVWYPDEPFIVWGSGEQGRAFVHVDDVVEALFLSMARGLGKGMIQIGPNVCTRIRDIAEILVEISKKDVEIRYDHSKPEGDRGRCADYTKAKQELGWNPKVDLRTGLNQVYEWIQKEL